MALNTEASAALVFLILYTLLFLLLLTGYITHTLPLRSRYSIIFFHITVRLASQATGLAFGIVGYTNTNLLVAYFILGAEGYFTLVLCTYRFLISWQNHNSVEHDSWLEPKFPEGTRWYRKLGESFVVFGPRRRPMAIIHNLLIAANAIIISGGSTLAGRYQEPQLYASKLKTAKTMRTAGQAIFLSINIFLLYCILRTILHRPKPHKPVHATLWILLAVWPLLFVRGLYGVLSAVLPAFNYFNPGNYGKDGLKDAFVVSEYVLGTTMEWGSCALLMGTYVTSRGDLRKAEWDGGKEGKEGKGREESVEA